VAIKTGRVGGGNGEAIDDRVFNASTMTASGVAATKFLGMAKTETTIALDWRPDARSDFKNHVKNSNVLR